MRSLLNEFTIAFIFSQYNGLTFELVPSDSTNFHEQATSQTRSEVCHQLDEENKVLNPNQQSFSAEF
jgi:hypothetical protein